MVQDFKKPDFFDLIVQAGDMVSRKCKFPFFCHLHTLYDYVFAFLVEEKPC